MTHSDENLEIEKVEEILPELGGTPEISEDRIDIDALWVVRRLRAKGYEAYLTGGCVRDLLLGLKPKDFDVATNAKPEEVKRIFRNCRLIGRRFLLAHVFFPGGKIIETATFRKNPTDVQEDLPEDLLVRQDNVYGNIEEDALRRDLTINGLFYDPIAGKVIDHVGGRKDLEARLIRTIGEPGIRFQEDPVRILRAIKFAARLQFRIDDACLQAMTEHAPEITRCAPARLQEEILRLLSSGHAQTAFMLCMDVGILKILMPELIEGLSSDLEAEEGKVVPSSEERMAYFKSLLFALDEVIQRDTFVPAAAAFSALLLSAYHAIEQSNQNERNWIDRLCVNWAERIRLTRHDQDRLRILLPSIALFLGASDSLKANQYLVRKPWFKEALLVSILHQQATGSGFDSIGLWKALAEKVGKYYKQDHKSSYRPLPKFRRRRPTFRPRGRRPHGGGQETKVSA